MCIFIYYVICVCKAAVPRPGYRGAVEQRCHTHSHTEIRFLFMEGIKKKTALGISATTPEPISSKTLWGPGIWSPLCFWSPLCECANLLRTPPCNKNKHRHTHTHTHTHTFCIFRLKKKKILMGTKKMPKRSKCTGYYPCGDIWTP